MVERFYVDNPAGNATISEPCTHSDDCSRGLICTDLQINPLSPTGSKVGKCTNICSMQAPSNDCQNIVKLDGDDSYEEAKIQCNNSWFMRGGEARTCYWAPNDGTFLGGCQEYGLDNAPGELCGDTGLKGTYGENDYLRCGSCPFPDVTCPDTCTRQWVQNNCWVSDYDYVTCLCPAGTQCKKT